ncbi:hypothetical protein [Streptomyces atroolivaceus]|uniref:hypothetical protein n=1 Tax=Streptomyces atroolivaceus TaxID=66869 RepID=UPI002024D7F6|nr:hypothetical protein [Streptomyces atroolivaceus]
MPRGSGEDDGLTLPQLPVCTVTQAMDQTGNFSKVRSRLQTFVDLDLGHLALGEAAPVLRRRGAAAQARHRTRP